MPTATAVALTQVNSAPSHSRSASGTEVKLVLSRKSSDSSALNASASDMAAVSPIDSPAIVNSFHVDASSSVAQSSRSTSINESLKSTPASSFKEHRLIVGVDFGTTYSGVAAVHTANPEDIDIIKNWPGSNGITSDKVPTEIAYTRIAEQLADADLISNAGLLDVRWGFQFKPEESRLRCIKLFLDRNQKLPIFVSPLDTAAQLRKHNKTVMDAVTDYLTKLYEHTMDTLSRRYGESTLASTKVEFVLTVPAVWSDAAKNATLQAAERAGMGNKHELKMISEPEAAAVYALKSVQGSNVSEGDNFVVCDAGGGTVDLIAYQVTSVAPLRVKESAVGTGGLCGSAFLNYRFEDFVRDRLGHERYVQMREKKPKTWMMGLKYFEENVKRNFNDEEDAEVNIPFPGLPDDEAAGLDGGFLTMSVHEVKAIFDPVIEQVILLLEGQVGKIREKGDQVAGIILVGGFGQSNYLYNQLKSHFSMVPPPAYSESPVDFTKELAPTNIEVMQPLYAWTAVVRGAVLRGLEGSGVDGGMITTRKSRCHYGTSYATVYETTKHTVAERYWSPLWERWMVGDRMQWHLAKGTSISQDTPISFHYTRNFRPGQSLIVEDDLIACNEDSAPDAFANGLVKSCTLKTDLNTVPKEHFTRLTTSKGLEFSNLDFELHMKIESADLVFELYVDGTPYGRVQAEFH